MSKVFIHIGYPKTATTWLQRFIFPFHKEINYLDHYKNENKWLLDLRYIDDLDFNPESFKKKYSELNIDKEKPVLISIESLSGDVFKRGFNSKRIADNLKEIFPDAKIIITVRNQIAMIDSLYKQYVNQGGNCNFKKFIELPAPKPVSFSLDYLKYHKLLDYYSDIFGQDSVFVKTYEHLKENPEKYLSELFLFIGVKDFDGDLKNFKVNRSLSPFSVGLLRFANQFLKSPMNTGAIMPGKFFHPMFRSFLQNTFDPFFFAKSKKKIIDKKFIEYLKSYYQESNNYLDKKYDLELGKYDYPL